jgi:hypothetical protein
MKSNKKISHLTKKNIKYKKQTKSKLNKISQRAGGAKISNVIVIHQYLKTFGEESVYDYNPELDFQLYYNSNYCNTDIPLGFEIYYIPIPISPLEKEANFDSGYTTKIIQNKVVDFIKTYIPSFEILDENIRIVYYISSLHNEYNFYNSNASNASNALGEMIINTLFQLKPAEFWKDKLDIYMNHLIRDKFVHAYINNSNNFQDYIKTLQSTIHKLLFLLPVTQLNNKQSYPYPISYLRNIPINVQYLIINNIAFEETKDFYCTQWFSYFIETMSKCGSQRLLQFSGTCYINVILNSLILGEGMRNLGLIQLYSKLYKLFNVGYLLSIKTYKQTLDTFVNIIERELNTCEKNKTMQMFKYIYQLLVKKNKFKTLEMGQSGNNIIKKFQDSSQIIYNNRKKNAGRYFLGYSSAVKTIEELFSELFPNEQKDFKSNKFKSNIDKKYRANKGIFTIPDSDELSPHNDNLIFINSDSRFYTPTISKNYTYDFPLNINYERTNTNYKLDSAQIILDSDKGMYSHIILGFICNNVPKIFDSNGILFTLDWITMLSTFDDTDITNIAKQQTIRSAFLEYVKSHVYPEFTHVNIYIDSLIYVNTEKKHLNHQEIVDKINIIINYIKNPSQITNTNINDIKRKISIYSTEN